MDDFSRFILAWDLKADMAKQQRGIHIPLSQRRWELVVESLTYVVEKPYLDDLEENRETLGRIVRYIKKKLQER